MGYSAKIFWIFFSQWDYQMVNTSRILKFLTWNEFDEFGWNNTSIFLFPWLKALRVLTCFFKGEQSMSLKDSFVMSKASSEDISVSYVILCMIKSGSNYEGNVWIHLMWLHQSSHSVNGRRAVNRAPHIRIRGSRSENSSQVFNLFLLPYNTKLGELSKPWMINIDNRTDIYARKTTKQV